MPLRIVEASTDANPTHRVQPVPHHRGMKPGERLRQLNDAAASLLAREHSEADVIIEEFGFKPWEPDRWDTVDLAWWMRCLRSTASGDLPGLLSYLRGDDAAPESSPAPAGTSLFVFLSHLHDHREFVAQVQAVLRHYGIESFVAHNDIPSGKRWRDEIRRGLQTCHALVAVLHSGFGASQWCDQEVGWALGRDVPVVPVRPPGADDRKTGFMGDTQEIGLKTEDAYHVAHEIVGVLLDDPRTHSRVVSVLPEALVTSCSYDRTRQVWDLIEKVKDEFREDELRRLQFAVDTNRQVYQAVARDGKPLGELVEQLLREHSTVIDLSETKAPVT